MRDEFNGNADSTMNDVDKFIVDLAAKQNLKERDDWGGVRMIGCLQ